MQRTENVAVSIMVQDRSFFINRLFVCIDLRSGLGVESEWIDPYRVGVNEKKRKKKLSTPQQWWEPTEREREKERMGGCLEVEVGAEAQGVQVAVEFGQVGAQQDVVGVVEGGHARLVQPVEGVQQRPVQQVGEAHERVGRLQVQQQRRRHERHALSQQKKPKTTRWVRSRSYSVAVRKRKSFSVRCRYVANTATHSWPYFETEFKFLREKYGPQRGIYGALTNQWSLY